MTRLLLVRHAATAATEDGRFGADEPVSPAGEQAAAALAAHLPAADAALASPALRCRQTAAALGLRPLVDSALAECRFGTWEGRTFADISAGEPGLVDGWLNDPEAAPHGGESLSAFTTRVRAWLDQTARRRDGGIRIAVTHAGVIRAAVVAALAAPVDVFWQIAAAPLAVTELEGDDRGWALRRLNWTAAL